MSHENLARDVSLEKAWAMQRVWQRLYDCFCPKCHSILSPAMRRVIENRHGDLECPQCHFTVEQAEIIAIETLGGHAMDAAVKVFEDWRESRKTSRESDSVAPETASGNGHKVPILDEMREMAIKAWKWDYIARGQFVDAATSIMCLSAVRIAEDAYSIYGKKLNIPNQSAIPVCDNCGSRGPQGSIDGRWLCVECVD